jgi:D-galacturonate reductase
MVEFHKRWDPIYADARERMRALGDCAFFSAYMSQPKTQLRTFAPWAGRASDISYYLNAHHIDVHAWAMDGRARPRRVTAAAATGVATAEPYNCQPGTEDAITLLVRRGPTCPSATAR